MINFTPQYTPNHDPQFKNYVGNLKVNLHINFYVSNPHNKRVIKYLVTKKLKIPCIFFILGPLVGGGGLKLDFKVAHVTPQTISFPTVYVVSMFDL